MNAEIVTTGTEILLGEIVDTNAAWIAQQLRDAGVNLFFKTTVGDNEARIRSVLELGLSRSDVIICSGGLGPTVDDITRDAIATVTNRPLQLHEEIVRTLEERFQRFGSKMSENNKRQAMIPQDAIVIPNPVGTAPGFIVEHERGTIIAVPGVPREMKHLMTETVLPYLRQRNAGGVIRRRVLRTMGLGESMMDNLLGELMHSSNPTIGTMAHTGQADLRIAARGANEAEVEALLDGLEAQVRERIGQYIYSTIPGESYEAVVIRHLQEAGLTLALIETNTQGNLATRIQKVAGDASPLLAHNVIPLDPAMLRDESARQNEVNALRQTSGATLALAIYGSSGANEGIYGDQESETWIVLATEKGVINSRIGFGGNDEFSITRIGNGALMLVEKSLLEIK